MNEDLILKKLLEHDEKLNSLVEKGEFQELKMDMLTRQDEILTILKKLDEERIFTGS